MSACSRSDAPLKRSWILLYGAPGFATALPAIPVYILLPELYATQTALSVAAIGIVFMVARLFDVVTDPLVGWTIDRYRTRWGRRKPWIALGGIICTPALILVVSPEADTGVPTLLAGLVMLYLGWTVFQIPYFAWASELTADHYQRTRLTVAREGMVLAGILAASALPVALAYAGVAEQNRFLVSAALTGVVGASAVTALLWFVPKEKAYPSAAPDARHGLWHALRGNGLFRRIVAAWLINGLANGFAVVHFPFFVTHVAAGRRHGEGLASVHLHRVRHRRAAAVAVGLPAHREGQVLGAGARHLLPRCSPGCRFSPPTRSACSRLCASLPASRSAPTWDCRHPSLPT